MNSARSMERRIFLSCCTCAWCRQRACLVHSWRRQRLRQGRCWHARTPEHNVPQCRRWVRNAANGFGCRPAKIPTSTWAGWCQKATTAATTLGAGNSARPCRRAGPLARRPSQALGASARWTKLSSASEVKFRPKSLLKPRPPDGPIYFPSPSYDLQQLPASVDARGSARGRFHRRADRVRRLPTYSHCSSAGQST